MVAKLPKLKKKKIEKLICGNGIAENGRKKKRIVAMELPKIGGERERENSQVKKIFCSIDSYSKKKYTYSYSFHMPVVFFIETVWFVPVCHVLSFHPVKVITIDSLHDLLYETNNYRFKYIDSYSCWG